jgi:hypothetical protein
MSVVRFSILLALATLFVMPVAAADTAPPPDPSGVVAETIATWEQATANRSDCIGDVTVRLASLDSGYGEYRTREALVVVERSLDGEGLKAALAHELAHHVFVSCHLSEDATFTADFYAAQGIPASHGWYDYSAGWIETPAELFAEAMTHHMIGRSASGVAFSDRALGVVADWLAAG